ncbi:hypothetical protein [Phreatobacter sp.]|uniref:hypothetical protein n=1 Tax=Phreatobacter sp. TaxID=1966341 RepID=UPI0022BCBA22|nr:hypothetical protein [Phreatobacter sp.]MCZ8314313.1 hypothetical protein [Phreatobacter sp.]
MGAGPDNEAADGQGSRGIVICAGGTTMFVNAYVLVRVLRDTLHCRLPIEIWHMGPGEMSPAMRALLEAHGVTVIDAAVPIAEAGGLIRDGWQLKAFALAHSGLDEVLLLDADQVPVEDPTPLFAWQAYRQAGAIFWPDIVDLTADNPVWALLGLQGRRTPSIESGQVLVDRRRHRAAIASVLNLNERADELYELVYGDKDTFLLGWLIAGADHEIVPHRPFVHPRACVQCDFDGRPLFQHRTNAKWSLGAKQVPVDNFVHEADCLGYIADLRRRWSGRIHHGPGRSLAARYVEAALASRRGTLSFLGGPSLELELLPHGEIGAGRDFERANWAVIDRPDAPEGSDPFTLILEGGLGRCFELHPAAGEHWVGTKLTAPGASAALHLAESPVQASPGLLPVFLAAAGYPACSDTVLENVLRVLDGVEPGVAGRLRHHAASLADPERLVGLAARLEDHAARRTDVVRPAGMLATTYADYRRPS